MPNAYSKPNVGGQIGLILHDSSSVGSDFLDSHVYENSEASSGFSVNIKFAVGTGEGCWGTVTELEPHSLGMFKALL